MSQLEDRLFKRLEDKFLDEQMIQKFIDKFTQKLPKYNITSKSLPFLKYTNKKINPFFIKVVLRSGFVFIFLLVLSYIHEELHNKNKKTIKDKFISWCKTIRLIISTIIGTVAFMTFIISRFEYDI